MESVGGGGRAAGSSAETAGIVLAVLMAAVNLVVIPGFTGMTLGKWATGLRIEKKDGGPVGLGRALHLALGAENIDAAEAERIGLVSRVMDPDALVGLHGLGEGGPDGLGGSIRNGQPAEAGRSPISLLEGALASTRPSYEGRRVSPNRPKRASLRGPR